MYFSHQWPWSPVAQGDRTEQAIPNPSEVDADNTIAKYVKLGTRAVSRCITCPPLTGMSRHRHRNLVPIDMRSGCIGSDRTLLPQTLWARQLRRRRCLVPPSERMCIRTKSTARCVRWWRQESDSRVESSLGFGRPSQRGWLPTQDRVYRLSYCEQCGPHGSALRDGFMAPEAVPRR